MGAIGLMIVAGGFAACSGQEVPNRTIVETDNATLPARFAGSASVSRGGGKLLLTITNVEGGSSSCDAANVSTMSDVANLFSLEVRINALSPSGDIVFGTYTDAPAMFAAADSNCLSAGEVVGEANVELIASGTGVAGYMSARFPGSHFVVQYQGPICGATTTLPDAGTSCVRLPPCTADAGGAPVCIDFP